MLFAQSRLLAVGQKVKNKDNRGFAFAARFIRCAMDFQEWIFPPKAK
jgi:hypothetical protein